MTLVYLGLSRPVGLCVRSGGEGLALGYWAEAVWARWQVLAAVLGFAGILAAQTGRAAIPADPPTVSTLHGLYELPLEALGRGLPVRLEATVNYVDAEWRVMFLEDSTGVLFVAPSEEEVPNLGHLRTGELVMIQAKTARTDGRPDLTELDVKPTGRKTVRKPVVLRKAFAGGWDTVNHWVELEGVVWQADLDTGRLRLEVMQMGRDKPTWIFIQDHEGVNPELLRDAHISVTGVHAMSSKQTDDHEPLQVFVPSMAEVNVQSWGREDPFLMPAEEWGGIWQRLQAGEVHHQIRVWGKVVDRDSDQLLRVRVGKQVLALRASAPVESQVEDEVDVVAFPVLESGGGVRLDSALVRTVRFDPEEEAAAANGMPLLQTAAQIRSLTVGESQRAYPVQIRGVVTYYDPSWGLLFVQDATAGVYVQTGGRRFEAAVGDRVSVQGISDPGGYAPSVANPRLEHLGGDTLPEARSMVLEQLMTGQEDSQWIQIDALVQAVSLNDDHLELRLATPGGRFAAIMPEANRIEQVESLVDARVRIQGACGAIANAYRQLVGVQVFVPDPSHLTVLQAAPEDPFDRATLSVQDLLRFIPLNLFSQRVKVAGVVTHAHADGQVFLQDAGGGVQLFSAGEQSLNVGDAIEAIGFCSLMEGKPVLTECRFRAAAEPLSVSQPRVVTVADIEKGEGVSQLVRLQARLLDVTSTLRGSELALQAGERVVTAMLEKKESSEAALDWKPGSLLEVTGVCLAGTDEWGETRSIQILLRSSGDLEVLEHVSWWTPQRVLATTSLFLLVSAIPLSWVILLRRQVRRQTRVIRDKLTEVARLEERYRELYENAGDIIWTLDLRGRYTSLNRAGEKFFGCEREEALGTGIADRVAPEDRTRAIHALEEVMKGHEMPVMSFEVVNKQGARLIMDVKTRLIMSDGKPVGMQSIARDVTQKKEAEQQLLKLSRVVEESPVSIMITDTSGKIEYVNPWFCNLTGYRREEVVGRKPSFLKSGETPAVEYRKLWRTIAGGRVWHGEFRNRKKSGELFWELASISPVMDLAGKISHFVAIKEDISEKRNLEGQLIQAQKMESVGQLAAGVAHDYNNLLTVIKGNVALLDMSEGLLPEQVDSLSEIARASDRAENLTRQLLAFSRRQILQRQSVNLNAIVSNLAKMLHRLLGEHITLEFVHRPGLPLIHADVGMVEQVIMNLSVNARDAMLDGGRLTLSTSVVDVDDLYRTRVPEAEPGRFVQLTVTDTGGGMDRETMDRIFEPFFTTKGVGKGTGLGLSTVFGIVKQHRGWVEVESRLRQGSTFRVLLPVAKESVPDDAAEPEEPSVLPGGDETILVVEDEPSVRQLAHRLLQREGYQVVQASCGSKAMELWPRYREDVQLLLTDMVMPGGMSGRELARRFREDKPQLKVVFMTGYSSELAGTDVLSAEDARMLSKPFSSAQLLRMVRAGLDGVAES